MQENDGKKVDDMSIQIAKPNDTVVVQVPASWTIRDIRLEQSRVHRWTLKNDIHTRIVVVGGGPETATVITPDSPAGITELEQLANH